MSVCNGRLVSVTTNLAIDELIQRDALEMHALDALEIEAVLHRLPFKIYSYMEVSS